MKGNPYEAKLEDGQTVIQSMGADYVANREAGMSNEDNVAALLENWGERLGDRAKKRSVISKLTHAGFYVKEEAKPKAPKDEGPTKKELMAQLRDMTGRDFDGLDNATKDGIREVIEVARMAYPGDADANAA